MRMMEGPETFIQRLRQETAPQHRALEQNPYARRLMSEGVALHDYSAYLARMYGFMTVFEGRVFPLLQHLFPDLESRRKSPLMAADLEALGNDPAAVACVDPALMAASFPDPAAALGGIYVLEGSTLGGMVIQKHLADKLGPAVTGKMKFFTCYGQLTGSRWKQFLGIFCQQSVRAGEEEVIKKAAETFSLLNEWFCSRFSPGTPEPVAFGQPGRKHASVPGSASESDHSDH